MQESVVYLTRHGHRLDWEEPAWREKAHDVTDPPLSSTGFSQAKELGLHLKGANISRILSSPYTRCLQTSTEVSLVCGVPIFIEFGISEWIQTAVPKTSLSDVNLTDWNNLITNNYTGVSPTINESIPAMHARCYEFVKVFETMDFKGTTLLVTHAAPLIGLVRAFLRDSTAPIFPGTCSLTKLVRKLDGSWTLHEHDSASHLTSGLNNAWKFAPNQDEELKGFKLY